MARRSSSRNRERYGPGDPSQVGEQLRLAQRGKLRYVTFGDLGFTAVHVDDVIIGLLLVLDRGVTGESYVLGAEPTTMKEAVAIAARTGGHKPPRLAMPTPMVKAMAPFGRVIGPLLGQPPNLSELSALRRVTYWATHAKAQQRAGLCSTRSRDRAAGDGSKHRIDVISRGLLENGRNNPSDEMGLDGNRGRQQH